MHTRPHRYFRRHRPKLAALVAAPLGIAAFVVPLTSTAAHAAPAVSLPSSCLHKHFCTYQNADYQGTQWNLSRTPGYWWYVGAGVNDQISSFWNWQGIYAYIAKSCPVGSDWTWIGVATANSNLAGSSWQDGSSINDSISAFGLGDVDRVKEPARGSRTEGGC